MKLNSYPSNPVSIYVENPSKWYDLIQDYWVKQESTIESVTGGVDDVSTQDLRYTYCVLLLLQSEGKITGGRVADCGGGIGRVSYQVLSHFFQAIDVIDIVPQYLLKARKFLEKEVKDVKVYQVSLPDWSPSTTYDAFYFQWILCNITDEDIVLLLQRCKENASPNCIFIVKENIAGPSLECEKSCYEYYPKNGSICRTFKHFTQLFRDAGLILDEYRVQPNWPEEYLPLCMFILHM